MKRVTIFALAAALAAAVPAAAQGPQLQFGGSVLNHDLMMSTDFAALSQTHSFGTARVMAMGGAFTSLGADLSSMSINPAGLGMYRRSEVAFTPFLSVANSKTAGTHPWQGDGKNRFSFSNIGIALNILERPSGALTSMTLGIGMNRIADFNTRYSYSTESVYDPSTPDRLMPTIADIFGQQLGQAGIFPGQAEGGGPNGPLGYDNNDPYFWPAILGYNSYMMSVQPDPSNPNKPVWTPDCIGHNASVTHSMDVVNSGSINEFALSMGANFSNIIYVGATLGIQSVHKKMGMTYQEDYRYYDANGNRTAAVYGDGTPLEAQLDYSSLYQQTEISGSGVNFKLGVVVRPVAGLRLGMAFHTPTFYSLDYNYGADIESQLYNNVTEKTQISTDMTPLQEDYGTDSWEFTSPARLLFGASYTFGNFALVSVDYERDWYNGIRVKNVPQYAQFGTDFYKQDFKNNFQGTSTIRAGVEVRPLPILALRVGGGYTDSMLKDHTTYYNSPTTYESYYVSAGVGINLSRSTVLDIAYQNVTNKQTAYQLFFSQDVNTGDWMTQSGFYDTKQTRHYIAMTLGIRF